MTSESGRVVVYIDRPLADVYAYASDPTKLPTWGAGVGAVVELADGQWHADSPLGRIVIEYLPDNPYGVLDHRLTLPTGEVVHNSVRVIAIGAGSEIVFSVSRTAGATDEDFTGYARAVEADLKTLKQLLEQE